MEALVWIFSVGCLLFFVVLGICSAKSNHHDGTPTLEPPAPRLSLMHLVLLGAVIMAIQLGQYTAEKQMKTECERIVLRP